MGTVLLRPAHEGAPRFPVHWRRNAGNLGALAVSATMGLATVSAGLNLDQKFLNIDLRDFVRCAYFSSVGLAILGPSVFLAPWLAAERETGRLESLFLTLVPRRALLFGIVRHTLAWPAFAWLLLAGCALFGFAQFPINGRWFDCWGLPSMVLLAPLGGLIASTGICCWLGMVWRQTRWCVLVSAVIPMALWPTLVYVGMSVLPGSMIVDLKLSLIGLVSALLGTLIGWRLFLRAADRLESADA